MSVIDKNIQKSDAQRRFKTYPAYKDSGIEWLGEVPEGWELKALKRTFRMLNGSTPKSGELSYWDGDIPWATPDDLGSLKSATLLTTQRMITKEGYDSCGTSLSPAGSLILSTRAPIGHLAITGASMCTNQGCRSLVFRIDDDRLFFFYQLSIARQELESWGQGSTFKELGRDKLGTVYLTTPSISEQRTIVAFLDRETAQIDALIAKKERQIELLQEKRMALISQAIIKGLDTNAKMKKSGIEWLGYVPEHWKIVPLKFITVQQGDAIKTGPFGSQLLSSEMLGGSIKVYNQRNVIDGDFKVGENYISEEKYLELKAFTIQPNDVLITTRGTIGRCALVPIDAELGILHPCLMRVQVDVSRVLPEYLAIMIQDGVIVRLQLALMSNATTIEVIYSESLKRVKLPVPPVEEQRYILSQIEAEVGRINYLIKRIELGVNKLREYRTALISSAVTGKIDVRKEKVNGFV